MELWKLIGLAESPVLWGHHEAPDQGWRGDRERREDRRHSLQEALPSRQSWGHWPLIPFLWFVWSGFCDLFVIFLFESDFVWIRYCLNLIFLFGSWENLALVWFLMFLDLGIKPAQPAPHGFSPFCAVCGCDFHNPQGCRAMPKKGHPPPPLSPMLSSTPKGQNLILQFFLFFGHPRPVKEPPLLFLLRVPHCQGIPRLWAL